MSLFLYRYSQRLRHEHDPVPPVSLVNASVALSDMFPPLRTSNVRRLATNLITHNQSARDLETKNPTGSRRSDERGIDKSSGMIAGLLDVTGSGRGRAVQIATSSEPREAE